MRTVFLQTYRICSLKDKVVAITGASSGIGKALADTALAAGAKVAVCARNLSRLEDSFAEHKGREQLLLLQADVSHEEDCRRYVEGISKPLGRYRYPGQ